MVTQIWADFQLNLRINRAKIMAQQKTQVQFRNRIQIHTRADHNQIKTRADRIRTKIKAERAHNNDQQIYQPVDLVAITVRCHTRCQTVPCLRH